MPTLLCPHCRYDLSAAEPADGVLRCPECGRTCTTREAADIAQWARERGSTLARETIIGATVGVLAFGTGFWMAWRFGLPAPRGLLVAGWAACAAIGIAGCAALARRARRTAPMPWPLLALLLALAWLAAAHAIIGVVVAVIMSAG